ncbi:hypothetical protein Ae201684P_001503 [Aphanomyces euteiches]|nr:hypothetical protein Ae201684P_001503 [Aphanomyces euteiches]
MNRPKEKNQIKSRTEEGCPPQKKIVRRRVTDLELLYLVEFLEDPTNFAIVVCKAVKGKSVIGGQTLTKVHEAYKAAHHRESGQSGQGLTDKDYSNGIMTSAAKLEDICFGYERMKSLFSQRQNINPSCVAEIGLVDESDDVDDVAVSNERVEDSVVSHEPENDENDPNKELYWELNDMEDPGVDPPQTLPTCGNETKTPTKQNKQRKPVGATPYSSKKRSIPAEFPVEEKRAKRDFVTAYSEGQAKILELEIKKFEHMKFDQARQSLANFIRDLLRDGQPMSAVEQAVQLAFGSL